MAVPSANRRAGYEIHSAWSDDNDPLGQRTLWITDGTHLGDFNGTSIAVPESSVPQLIEELKKLIASYEAVDG